jgi:uncharacterized membrane protein
MEPLPTTRKRILSIDILRGIIMLIMALDHVRDFVHESAMQADPLNLETTTAPLFFTRWITHYCAPIFLFLSGLSAYISGQRKTRAELSRFLISRGIWLVLVELLVITLAITYDPFYRIFVLQVIWAIGWSMILLGLLVRTSYAAVLILGIVIVLGHNITDFFPQLRESKVMELLFTTSGAFWQIGTDRFVMAAYAILPWTGIMFLGYALGKLYSAQISDTQRRKWLLYAGAGSLLLFVLLRVAGIYGDPSPWSQQSSAWLSFLSFINVTKYPVSLQYSLMTLGVAMLSLAWLESARGRFANFLVVYGRVPFFYYVLHFFLIHAITVAFFFAEGRGSSEILDPNSPFLFRPVNFGYSLMVVYLVWLGVILILYKPCKWFMELKQRRKEWWLSYV